MTKAGELSPWQRLLAYVAEKDISITSVALYAPNGQRWNMPSAGKNPKFHAFSVAPQPVSYKMFRKIGGDVIGGEMVDPEVFTVAEATYKDGNKVQLWVDNKNMSAWVMWV